MLLLTINYIRHQAKKIKSEPSEEPTEVSSYFSSFNSDEKDEKDNKPSKSTKAEPSKPVKKEPAADKKPATRASRSASRSRKAKKIQDDDEEEYKEEDNEEPEESDDEIVKPGKKSIKKEEDEDDGFDDDIEEIVKPAKSRRKVINEEEEDDGFDDDEIEVVSTRSKRKAPTKTTKSVPVKKLVTKDLAEPTKPKSQPKPAAPKSKPDTKKSASAAPAGGSTAQDILRSIPDAILPDVDPSKPINFHALMASRLPDDQPGLSDDIEIPVAQENCLAGLKIIFTGTMPHLSRERASGIVKQYGGEVVKSLSGRTSLVVIGADAGPAKIKKIKSLGTKTIDEDGFLQLLRDMPASGGSGEVAQKAMLKKQEEEKKIEQAAREMQQNNKKDKQKTSSSKGKVVKEEQEQEQVDDELWTTKYAPKKLSDIIGNAGAVKKLSSWLANWQKNYKTGFKKPGPDGSGIYRAVIIHGPPGIGKTTAAHLVAELQGYDVIENNASDTRSKNLLAENVTGTLSNTSISGFFGTDHDPVIHKQKKNIVMIMDEVDGMSGGDRGGVGQMAALCRTTNIPIILVCNERTLPKMRPFDRVTYDIPFRRPDANAARVRIMSIARSEGLNLEPGVVDQLVASTHADIRQILNMLSTFATTHKNLSNEKTVDMSKQWEKEVVLKPFDIVGRFFSGATFSPNSKMTMNDKIELYFNDHDFTPLMIQENYLNTLPARTGDNRVAHLDAVVKAAESISDGDLVDSKIHGSQQQWSLMPLHAVVSSIRPAFYVAGQGRTRFNFTSYLGNNSKKGKYDRLLQEIHAHARLRISGDRQEVRQDYMPLLTTKLLKPLVEEGADGVSEIIKVMDEYYLTKEDWDVIMELGVGSNKPEDVLKSVPTAVKSGFTRKYNTTSHPVPFMKSASSLSAKATASVSQEIPDLPEALGEEIEPSPEDTEENGVDEDEDVGKDKYIKVGKPKTKRAAKRGPASTGDIKETKTPRKRATTSRSKTK